MSKQTTSKQTAADAGYRYPVHGVLVATYRRNAAGRWVKVSGDTCNGHNAISLTKLREANNLASEGAA